MKFFDTQKHYMAQSNDHQKDMFDVYSVKLKTEIGYALLVSSDNHVRPKEFKYFNVEGGLSCSELLLVSNLLHQLNIHYKLVEP